MPGVQRYINNAHVLQQGITIHRSTYGRCVVARCWGQISGVDIDVPTSMFLLLSLLFYFSLIRLAAFFTAINSTWVIDFLDILAVLILSLPEASRTLVEGIIMCPECVVVGSFTIMSAITGLAPRAAPYTLLRRISKDRSPYKKIQFGLSHSESFGY